MAQPIKDSFLDLERHRQLLEDNIEKLRTSLRHWQLWEAEYEGLKEEILAAGTDISQDQFTSICDQYEGTLVTKKEIQELLGGVKISRTPAQVVNLLDRRLDYVEQNVKTVQKQIETAEHKLAAMMVVSVPDTMNEEGLPVMDIVEELDEEGNVISSHVNTPGSKESQLLEVLEKAGVKVPQSQNSTKEAQNGTSSSMQAQESMQQENKKANGPSSSAESAKAATTPKSSSSDKQEPSSSKKKGVKFAEDTKPGPEVKKSQTAQRVEQIMDLSRRTTVPPSEPPVIPTNESPQDAALRREMLQYGMSEVGAVVAELDIEEGSDWSDEDYDEEEMTSTDDEDQYGRSTRRVVDDELRKQMMELEQRLGVRSMENIGKEGEVGVVQEGIGRIKIKNTEEEPTVVEDEQEESVVAQAPAPNAKPKTPRTDSAKKSVRFSEALDIAPISAPEPIAKPSMVPRRNLTAPVSDIVERDGTAPPSLPPRLRKKVSRFASHLQASPSSPPKTSSIPFAPVQDTRPVPTGPKNKIIASEIIERDIPEDTDTITEPDDFDERLLHQEVATEYHNMRNRMIQRQGGFVQEEEKEFEPLGEEEGGPKKMSRFKAARLGRF